jgi:hypothetical protein
MVDYVLLRKEIKENDMEWAQILTLIGFNIAFVAVISTLIIWVVNKLDTDIKNVSIQVESLTKRLDGHAMRIDQLYHMFIDLLK